MGLMLAEPGFHTRCFVEWEQYPQEILRAGMDAGYFEPAPIWTDVTTFDAKPFAGAFDTRLAGYPCQPFSQAGQRKGENDERHLWPDIARIIRELGDHLRWVFVENVAGHVTLGAETVLRELRELGFTPAAGIFSAEEVGAPHERQRWFCVAYREGGDGRGEHEPRSEGRSRSRPSGGGTKLADADGRHASAERKQRGGQLGLQPEDDGSGRADVADAGGRQLPIAGRRSQGRDGARPAGPTDLADSSQPRSQGQQSGECYPGEWQEPLGLAGSRGGAGLFPPAPGDSGAWASILAGPCDDHSPALGVDEILLRALRSDAVVQEASHAALEPIVRRVVDGLATRSRALRLLGNGVCPLEAGYAWRSLSLAHGLWPVDLEWE